MPPVSMPTAEDEFEAAFAEAAKERLGAAVPTDGDRQTQVREEPGPATAPATQESEPSPMQGSTDEPQAQPTDDVESLRRQLAEANHRERSASARISAFQRKVNEAQERVRELERRLQPAVSTEATPAPSPAETAEDDKDLRAVLDEMPELGRAVDRLVARKVEQSVASLKQQAQQVEQAVRPAVEMAQQAQLQRELEIVEREFPGWRETVNSPEWIQFTDELPPSLRAAYDNAQTASEACAFLRMFNKGRPPVQPQAEPAQQASATAPPPTAAKKPDLTKAVGIPSRPVAKPVVAMPDESDFEGAFEFFASQRQKRVAAMR